MTFHSQQRYSYPWGFRNSEGSTMPGMSIACVTGAEFKDNELILILAKPSTSFIRQIVVTEPIDCAASGYGRCAIGGIVPVKYDSGTPAFGDNYGFKPSQSTISKGFYGCRVLKLLDSTAKIAQVELNEITTVLGKASGSISARSSTTPGSGSMEIWYNNAGTLTDAGFSDITVKNLSASAVTSGGYIQAKLIAGEWFVDFEDCP